MAWKLKKWKGAEAEEEQPEDGVFDITGSAPEQPYTPQPAAFADSEPSQAFNAPPRAEPAAAQTPEPEPSVIAMGPAEPEAIVAPPPPQRAPAPDLELDEPIVSAPADFSTSAAEALEESPDYYAESIAHADEAVAAFQEASAVPVEDQPAIATPPPAQQPPVFQAMDDEEPIAFEIEPPGAAVANLHERPVSSDTDDLPPPAPQRPATSPLQADADTMGAFAPYQPAPPNGTPAAAPAQSAPPAFEDDLSFAPPFASRLIVKIGPFSATYEIDKPEFSIGRPDPKTGNAPDIPLEWDDAVSRQHARILRRPDGDYLEDVGSSNGTLLNGQMIAVNTPILLKNEDVITIGERTQISYVR